MVPATKRLTTLLVVGGLLVGTMVGWGISKIPEGSAEPVPSSAVEPAPQADSAVSTRWMLTYNGAIVIGEKFETEAECEKGRHHYIDTIVVRVRTQMEHRWGRGYTGLEYPYFRADMTQGEAAIREAEATYCSSYSL